MTKKIDLNQGVEYIASAAYSERQEIDHVIATACGDIARASANFVRQICPLGEICILGVRFGCDDSGEVSSTKFSCIAEEPGCKAYVEAAAERTEERVTSLVSLAKRRVEETISNLDYTN